MKTLALRFQIAIRFHPSHPKPKMLVNSFSDYVTEISQIFGLNCSEISGKHRKP